MKSMKKLFIFNESPRAYFHGIFIANLKIYPKLFALKISSSMGLGP